mmetsp:Transcript_24813/g.50797  ORF Transcript_24813/g.50797 Transcript_24813/m.50797 type:complete len:159 (+) Transcript_24813:1-477(+)
MNGAEAEEGMDGIDAQEGMDGVEGEEAKAKGEAEAEAELLAAEASEDQRLLNDEAEAEAEAEADGHAAKRPRISMEARNSSVAASPEIDVGVRTAVDDSGLVRLLQEATSTPQFQALRDCLSQSEGGTFAQLLAQAVDQLWNCKRLAVGPSEGAPGGA